MDLKAGRGMATALAAELNGYPGPMHVLEFADQLQLTNEQLHLMAALMEIMRRDAIKAGEELIAAEADLDNLFASGQADEVSLVAHMHKISQAQGQVRLVHLRTHLPTRAALTSEQIEAYAKLRGYRPH
jgi:Spy/CpxP family protein refolding chaperone